MTASQRSDGLWRKFSRSELHLQMFEDDVLRWEQSNRNNPVHAEEMIEGREWVLSADYIPPDLVKWGLIFGDFIHNLRSSLDHLAYQLAVTASGMPTPPNERVVNFPIYSKRSKFRAWRNDSRRARHIPRGGVTLLEAAQPYPRRHREHLWLLQELDNMDKHRLIAETLIVPSHLVIHDRRPLDAIGVDRIDTDVWPEKGTMTATLTGSNIVIPPGAKVNVKFTTVHEPFINFDGTDRPLREAAGKMLDETRTVIESLIPLL